MNKMIKIRVRATKDFHVAGNVLVVSKGDLRVVTVVEGEEFPNFWTYTNRGSTFGSCKVGDGWEFVSFVKDDK